MSTPGDEAPDNPYVNPHLVGVDFSEHVRPHPGSLAPAPSVEPIGAPITSFPVKSVPSTPVSAHEIENKILKYKELEEFVRASQFDLHNKVPNKIRELNEKVEFAESFAKYYETHHEPVDGEFSTLKSRIILDGDTVSQEERRNIYKEAAEAGEAYKKDLVTDMKGEDGFSLPVREQDAYNNGFNGKIWELTKEIYETKRTIDNSATEPHEKGKKKTIDQLATEHYNNTKKRHKEETQQAIEALENYQKEKEELREKKLPRAIMELQQLRDEFRRLGVDLESAQKEIEEKYSNFKSPKGMVNTTPNPKQKLHIGMAHRYILGVNIPQKAKTASQAAHLGPQAAPLGPQAAPLGPPAPPDENSQQSMISPSPSSSKRKQTQTTNEPKTKKGGKRNATAGRKSGRNRRRSTRKRSKKVYV
jgi:hypothetical protein